MDRDSNSFTSKKEEISKDFAEWVAENSQRAHEYAVLTLRSLLLVSGGGLVAIPALAGLSDDFRPDIGVWAAIWFAASILLCILCSYFAYWNWSVAHIISVETRNHYIAMSWQNSGAQTVDEEAWKKRESALQRYASQAFWFAHVTGLAAMVLFVFGAITLSQAFDFSSAGGNR